MNSGRTRIVQSCTAAAILALGAGQVLAQNTTCGGPGLTSAPDLVVGDVTGPQNYTATGGYDALSLGTTSCNIGNVNVQWNACNNTTHPVIGGNLYRYSTVNGATRFEQVGQSWLKHAFTALTGSICCTCNGQGGSVLGVGCSDPYTAGRNGTQSGLGPRSTVNAFTGTYPSTTCSQHPSGGNTGTLEVALTDLVVTSGGSAATTRYFGESQYVNHDDATWSDANHPAGWLSTNNASCREIAVSGGPSDFTFAFATGANTIRYQSAIQQWHAIDPTVTQSIVTVPGEGEFIICSKATSIAGGLYHYEYAVYNMNSDRSGGSFTVPVDDSLAATNVGFHGVLYRGGDGAVFGTSYDGTPWPSTKTGGQLSWATTPQATSANANAIRWGTTYNFRFDTTVAPTTGNVTLGLWKSGSPTSISAAAQIPGVPPPAAPTNVQASNNPACNGGSTTLSGTVGAGQTIDWYTGSCGGSLVGSGTSLPVTPGATTTYYARARVTATGSISTTCSSVTVTTAQSVLITQNPAPVTVQQGLSASFHVLASGTSPTYHWRHGGSPISDGGDYTGTATPDLTINPAMMTDAGSYDVVVSNGCNSQTSNIATLLVTACGSADFNGDGDIGTDADIEAFFACLAGNCCVTCGSPDFNGDGDIGTDADIESFFRVLGGGNC